MNRRRPTLLAIPLAAMLLAACDSEQDMQSRLTMASAKLEAIPSGRGTIPSQQTASGVYREVREILQPVIDGGLPAEQAAATLIVAETEFAEAADKLRSAATSQRDALERTMEVEATIGVWHVADGRRSLAEAFDASAERQKLQDEIAQLDESIANGQQELQSLRNELDQINAQMQDLSDRANAERAQAARLEIEADAADADTALPLISQAQDHARAADALIMQAEQLRGQIEKLAPKIDRVELRIAGDENAREVRQEDLQGLTESEQFHEAQAREAAQEASAIRDELVGLVFGDDGLASFHEGELTGSLSEATSALERAQGTARRASGELRQQSQLLVARISQAQGQALSNQAHELTRFRRLLERLASIEAIASAEPRIAAELEAIRSEEAETYEQAAQAFEAASEAFGGAGMRGDAQAMLEELQSALNKSTQAARDRASDLGGGGG